jgi:hypothetical protein
MMRSIVLGLFTLLMTVSFFSCEQKSNYQKLLERELASGERFDSLFLDLELGMTSKEFYVACWEMNKQGLLRQGSANTTVVYDLGDQLPYSAKMEFFPTFHEDKIIEMPVMFRYDAWSPWNRNLWADSLQLQVLDLLEEWHGEGFIRADHPKLGTAYVKIDGNRRIALTTLDDQFVQATYTDMSVDLPEPDPAAAPVKEGEETD